MRSGIVLLLLAWGILGAGCAGPDPFRRGSKSEFDDSATGAPNATATAKSGATKPGDLIVTPGSVLTGHVVRYNEAGRFVVVDFPPGPLPQVEQRLFLYRRGLKVGEARVSDWRRENLIVADLLAGEAHEGDQVSSK
jgi:hypothetical protein